MTLPTSRRLLTRLDRLLAHQPFAVLSDRELLLRFTRDRNPDAFAVLVRRHAALVLGVGRRVPDRNLDQLWADLADDDAAKACRAIRALAGSPDNATPFLRKRLEALLRPADARPAQAVLLPADRAIEALERMDGEAARQALKDVATRARSTSLEASAAASLQRATQRQAGSGR